MHEIPALILTLAGGLAFALILGYLAQRIGMSPLVGYLIAGIIIGPGVPGVTIDREYAEQLSEIGVILLLFGVGLQFHFKELLAVKRIAIPGALIQTTAATLLGAVVLFYTTDSGWDAAIVYGFALALASSVVIIRVLSDCNHLHTPTGHIAIGWEVFKDLLTVAALVLIPLLLGPTNASGGEAALQVLYGLLKFVGLVVFIIFGGGKVIPWVLAKVAVCRSRELFTLTILVIALGIAVCSAKIFGVSMAMGALLAGLVVGRSDFAFRAASEAMPFRDAFAVLFFVSTGMLFEPRSFIDYPVLIATTLVVVLVAKPLLAFFMCVILKYPSRISLGVGAALANVGEFTFIISAVGSELDLFCPEATGALIAVAIVSISLSPFVYWSAGPLNRMLSRVPWAWNLLNPKNEISSTEGNGESCPYPNDPEHRAVIVGHGPVGSTVARLLREQGIMPTIIELNHETVQSLKAAGHRVILGDATLHAILEEAGVAESGTLVLSVSGFKSAREVIKIAREINPDIHVIVHAAYLADIEDLREVGANQVFSGEGEVALGMTEYVLEKLGATPEQIDRERDRVHGELFLGTTD